VPTKEADLFGERRKSLEEEFFHKQNQQLVDRLRATEGKKAIKEALARIASDLDEHVLDQLIDLGMQPETFAAIWLVPLVAVAWADGKVDNRERQAILRAAEEKGLTADRPGHALLQEWLGRAPDAKLVQLWEDYVATICRSLSPADREEFKNEVLDLARGTAEAAGGLLGLAKVSAAEERVLARLARSFA
jgi:hypothetical protein